MMFLIYLSAKKCSSLRDIKIIYNIIMEFPYCLDEEGHYVYNGEFYDSMDDFPNEAKEQILHHNLAGVKNVSDE